MSPDLLPIYSMDWTLFSMKPLVSTLIFDHVVIRDIFLGKMAFKSVKLLPIIKIVKLFINNVQIITHRSSTNDYENVTRPDFPTN